MIDISDKDVFESATSVEPAPVADAAPPKLEAETPPATEDAHIRDDKGRFAPKEREAQPQSETSAETPEPRVPPHRLREEAEARRQAEDRARSLESESATLRRELEELRRANVKTEPQEPPPSLWENEQAWGQNLVGPLEKRMVEMRVDFSRQVAEVKHGSEKVRAAYQAFAEAAQGGDPAAVYIASNAEKLSDPFGAIIDWHSKASVVREIGTDPEAYKEKLLSDPEFLAKAVEMARKTAEASSGAPQGQQPPAFNLPPSLNSSRGSSPAAPATSMSDSELFRFATTQSR